MIYKQNCVSIFIFVFHQDIFNCGTTIQENINNGMWNYGAVLSLIMLVFILAMEVFSDKKEEASANDGGLI